MADGAQSGASGSLTWRALLREAESRLGPNRRHEARWLVERATGYTGADHLAHLDDPAATRHVAFFDAMLDRRLRGEPLQYVLGRWQFRELELVVDRRVLIPRPETEVVAGLAIDALRRSAGRRGLDLGTGSGAIALAMLTEVPRATIWATDVSADALAVARANLAGLGSRDASRVTLLQGSWFSALPPTLIGSFDVIASNPPYVPDRAVLPAEVAEWEPSSALRAGSEGLDDVAQIVGDASRWLVPGGMLIVEISPEQSDAAVGLARDAGLVDTAVRPDLTGRPRALAARRRGV